MELTGCRTGRTTFPGKAAPGSGGVSTVCACWFNEERGEALPCVTVQILTSSMPDQGLSTDA